MTRQRATAIVLTALLAAGAAVIARDALAIQEEAVALPAERTVEREFGPIPANDPVFVTADHTIVDPPTCAALPSCALVPLDIEVPVTSEGDDFSISLTIEWDSETVTDNNVQPLQSNDLDVFLYDDGQTAEAEGGEGYTEVGSSASADNPEVISVYEPLLGRYNLVVINFVGGNTGWKLTARSIVGEFVTPLELLAPAPGSGTRNPNNKPFVTTTTTPPTTLPLTATTSVSIPEGVVLPDADFDGGAFDPEAAFTDSPQALEGLEDLELTASRPAAPSWTSVLLWMLLLPAVLVAFVLVGTRGRRPRTR